MLILKDKYYNALKFIALVLLPGISAAYFSFGQLWDFPNTEKVIGTLTIVDTFLGLVLKSSSTTFKKLGGDGQLLVQEDEGQKYLSLGLKQDQIDGVTDKDTVTLRVVDMTNDRQV